MKRIAIAAAFAAACISATAEELKLTSIGVHIGSHHWPAQNFNNFNPGVYATVSDGEWEYIAGTYYNSERRQTFYAGLNFQPYSWLSLQVIGATGYRRPFVAVVPTLQLPVADRTTLNVSVLPKVEKYGSWVAHLSIQYRFE